MPYHERTGFEGERIEVGPANLIFVQLSSVHELTQIRQEYDERGIEELARSIVTHPDELHQAAQAQDYVAISRALDLSHPLILNRLDADHLSVYVSDHARYYDTGEPEYIPQDDQDTLVLISGHRRRRALELIAKEYDFELDKLYVGSTIHENLSLHEAQRKQYAENISQRPPAVDEAKVISNYYKVEQAAGRPVTLQAVAHQFGCSESKVASAIAFDRLPKEIREYVADENGITSGDRPVLPFSLVARMGVLVALYEERYSRRAEYSTMQETKQQYVTALLAMLANSLTQMRLKGRSAHDIDVRLSAEIATARGELRLQTEELFVIEEPVSVRRQKSSSALAGTAIHTLDLLEKQGQLHPDMIARLAALVDQAKLLAQPAVTPDHQGYLL
ncbi:MAG: hypothetical protein UY35_C0007G0054 [Candidatus Saccharibacteria bacterium GW2011_GWC2_48_9]|nr:MAG: hypothetical protein UY35_C0007G0054 [Candidatus Saccharibacteria bacterium GW2011_GWC2_48_9]